MILQDLAIVLLLAYKKAKQTALLMYSIDIELFHGLGIYDPIERQKVLDQIMEAGDA